MNFRICILSMLLALPAMSSEIVVVDLSKPIEDQLEQNCPWIHIDQVKNIELVERKNIGQLGGDAAKYIGAFSKSIGANMNYSTMASDIPRNTKAVLMETRYYNNDGLAVINVNNLSLITSEGALVQVPLNEDLRNLNQTHGSPFGEALLVCFTNGDDFVRISAEVSHENVDGARPTLGWSAFVPSPSENRLK